MKNTPLVIAAGTLLLFSACKGPSDKTSGATDSTASTEKTTEATAPSATADSNLITTKEYQMMKPDGWQKTEKTMNNFDMVFLSAPKEDNYQSNINVLKDDMKGKNLEDYIAYNLNQMKSMNVKDLKSEDFTAGGITGKQLSYTYDFQGRNVAVRSYVLPKNGVAYVLTATTLVSTADKFTPEFDKIVQSFKVL